MHADGRREKELNYRERRGLPGARTVKAAKNAKGKGSETTDE